MNISISYLEIQDYIAKHYHTNVMLVKVSEREICVSVSQKVLIKTVQMNLNLRVDDVNNDSIRLTYNSGFGIDLIISGLLTFLEKKLPEYGKFISRDNGNRLRIQISEIEKLSKILNTVTLTNISFLDQSVQIGAEIK